MGQLSGWEIFWIILVLVLVFGAGKLPSIASSVGKSMKVFKKEVSELRDDEKQDPPAQQPPTTLPASEQPQQFSSQPYSPGQPQQMPPSSSGNPDQPDPGSAGPHVIR